MAMMFTKEVFGEYPKPPDIPMAIEGLTTSLFFTNFRGSSDVNYQLNYAFNGDIYYYVFGNKLGLCQIDGIGIPTTTICPNTSVQSGAKDFVDYYQSHKLGSSSEPIRISVGGMVLSGYFVSLNVVLAAGKENTYIFSFGFIARISGTEAAQDGGTSQSTTATQGQAATQNVNLGTVTGFSPREWSDLIPD